jgi:hypothetical protein
VFGKYLDEDGETAVLDVKIAALIYIMLKSNMLTNKCVLKIFYVVDIFNVIVPFRAPYFCACQISKLSVNLHKSQMHASFYKLPSMWV